MNNDNASNDNRLNPDNILLDPQQVVQDQKVDATRGARANATHEEALLNNANANPWTASGPISSGQQSSTASDASGVGGYSTPESGYGQSQAQGGFVEPQGGYNQGSYNQPGNYSQSQDSAETPQDGYRDTEGSSYTQSQGNPAQAQQMYDPTQSGAQSSQKTPGTVVDTPGRETGSAWGQDQEMGETTNTQDRRNPSE